MRKILIAAASAAAILVAPSFASAQDAAAGGAAVGAVAGGAIGAGAGAASQPDRVYVAPAAPTVVERDCIQDAYGRTSCVERVR